MSGFGAAVMSGFTLQTGIQRLRVLLAGQDRLEESDEQLLSDFTMPRDDNAFAVLVRRHGRGRRFSFARRASVPSR
jgi:hypothetical protein